MKRLTILLMLVAVAACGDDPFDPSVLAGARFNLLAVDGNDVPTVAWDFLGDPVTVDSGELEFTAARYFEIVERCIHDCAGIPNGGTWSRAGDEVSLVGDLGRELLATFDGAKLSYDDGGHVYVWDRR